MHAGGDWELSAVASSAVCGIPQNKACDTPHMQMEVFGVGGARDQMPHSICMWHWGLAVQPFWNPNPDHHEG